MFNNKEGDIEKFGSGEIDNRGLRTLGMNPIVFDGLAADTDGDVFLVCALYDKKSMKEAELILPSNSYINYANGTIRNKIIEDFMYV